MTPTGDTTGHISSRPIGSESASGVTFAGAVALTSETRNTASPVFAMGMNPKERVEAMNPWDRSMFATSAEELEIEEAIRAVERILDNPLIRDSTRVSIRLTLEALRANQR